MSDYLLSICIPTYNRADIVYQCVKNCLQIPYDWIEVVVVNNASTDNTLELLSEIENDRLSVYTNEKNIGYVNLMYCLTKGMAKYSLLLGDEDDFIDTDWELVKEQLEHSEDFALFQFDYVNEDGHILVGKPQKVYNSNEIETYKKILSSFGYAGGVIIKNQILKEVWENSYKPDYLWELYPEIILPMYCSQNGKYGAINNLKVTRSKRNNASTLDTSAWCAGNEEPYWTYKSREKQNEKWFEFADNFKLNPAMTVQFYKIVMHKGLNDISLYYWTIHLFEDVLTGKIFSKYSNLIERDQLISDSEWRKYYRKMKKRYKNEVYIKRKVKRNFSDIYGFVYARMRLEYFIIKKNLRNKGRI